MTTFLENRDYEETFLWVAFISCSPPEMCCGSLQWFWSEGTRTNHCRQKRSRILDIRKVLVTWNCSRLPSELFPAL